METREVVRLPADTSSRSITSIVVALGGAVTFSTLLLMGCQPEPGELAGRKDPSAEEARSPLEVVNLRMQAYNEHDLDALLSTYSEEVEIFTYPDQSLGKGKRRLESLFEDLFRGGPIHVDIHHQITKDSYVINHETVVSGDETTD